MLFVGPQEAGDLGAEQLDEGLRQHLLVFLCVLEVVLGVGQYLKEGLDELLVLEKMAAWCHGWEGATQQPIHEEEQMLMPEVRSGLPHLTLPQVPTAQFCGAILDPSLTATQVLLA